MMFNSSSCGYTNEMLKPAQDVVYVVASLFGREPVLLALLEEEQHSFAYFVEHAGKSVRVTIEINK